MSAAFECVIGGQTPEDVMADTWGHLAPSPGRAYPGVVLSARSEWGETVLLRADFPGLPDSPWFYGDLLDMVAAQLAEAAGLYVWRGTYERTTKGQCRFAGKATVVGLGDLAADGGEQR